MYKTLIPLVIACLYSNNAFSLFCGLPDVTIFPSSIDDVPTNFRPKVWDGHYKIVEVSSCEGDTYDGGISVNSIDAGKVNAGESDGGGCEPIIVAENLSSPVLEKSPAYLEPHTQYELRLYSQHRPFSSQHNKYRSILFTTGAGPDDSVPATPVLTSASRSTKYDFEWGNTTGVNIFLEELVVAEPHWYFVEFSENEMFDDPQSAAKWGSPPRITLASGPCIPSVGANIISPSYVRLKSVDVAGNASDFSEPVWIASGCGCSSSSQSGDGLLWLGVFAFGFVYLRRRT